MKRILVLLSLLFAFCTPAFCNELKIIVLSDIHLDTSVANNKAKLTESVLLLQETINQANEIDADMVLFAGDNIDRPDKKNLVVFAKTISKLNKPYYVIPGNHDLLNIQGLDKKEFYRLLGHFSSNEIKNTPCVKPMKGGLVLIFMDGINQYMPNRSGYFKEKELVWLDKQLSKYKDRKVVIVQHFPVVVSNKKLDYKTYKAREYLNVLAAHDNVIAIISGHTHTEDEIQQDGVLHISVPSLFTNQQYKEVDIEYGRAKGDYLIKSKIHSLEQE